VHYHVNSHKNSFSACKTMLTHWVNSCKKSWS